MNVDHLHLPFHKGSMEIILCFYYSSKEKESQKRKYFSENKQKKQLKAKIKVLKILSLTKSTVFSFSSITNLKPLFAG